MRSVDTPVVLPPAPGALRHLAAFAGAGVLLAVGGGSIWVHVVGGERLLDGWQLGGLLGWITLMTVGEAVRLRFGGRHGAVTYAVGFVGALVIGVAVGAALDATGFGFALTLPTAITATVIGVAWLFAVERSVGRRRADHG
ncbi:MAG TPA: hypothetical protein VK906_17785 [Egicoccus sp.]|nr:hypothetical protein [Egicoccus sp.]HSK25041.1 hypothetical protein [Egicoccus sp.]